MIRKIALHAALPFLFAALPMRAEAAPSPRRVEFNRDIRPILSENCLYCHGQDPKNRKADLRLDVRENALAPHDDGTAIVPGKPESSDLVKRLVSTDRDEVMPPPKSNRKVTPEQVALLRRWIAEGAEYQKHWAFIPPKRPALPELSAATAGAPTSGRVRNPIDRFVLARLEAEGMAPSPEAAPSTWLRRVSLDLTGLPPAPAEIDGFIADVQARGEAAYEAAVDRLLASPHFGERMAIDWLDAARYADTHGFNNDSARTMWRWRDWVIEAFNSNKPYDQFITEQLAGDLLPQATVEQRLATGFCRNHVINSEGGIIDEEYRVEYVSDRVRTMSMAWMGLTMECCRCHDHKYDPVTQRDYYRMFAFFNNVPEYGEDGRIGNCAPIMPAPTHEQAAELRRAEAGIAALDGKLEKMRAARDWSEADIAPIKQLASEAAANTPEKEKALYLPCENAQPVRDSWSLADAAPLSADGVAGRAWHSDGTSAVAKIEGKKVKFDRSSLAFWLRPDAENPRDTPILSNQSYSGVAAGTTWGKGQEIRLVDGEIEVRINERFPAYALRVASKGAEIATGAWRHVTVSYLGGGRAESVRIFVDGCEVATRIINDGLTGAPTAAAYLLGADGASDSVKFRGSIDEIRVFNRPLTRAEIHAVFERDALPYALAQTLGGDAGGRERGWLRDGALEATDAAWRAETEERGEAWEKYLGQRRSLPEVMVMSEMAKPRQAYVLTRGNYDAHGEAVSPGAPEELLAPWPAGAPRNRLGLARWLTQPNHPLVARVVVNRFWAQLFGTGIVKTLADFGSQGEWPSHPELLDWLAREFVDGGWNVKALFKTLVLSATYRQDSQVSASLAARDPENRLLARGPRFRLPAEILRDQALAISGLLKNRVGGPSVYPYQPEKLYDGLVVAATYPGTRWELSKGDDLYRRSLYTFWKRTVPHPLMIAFDAPDREFCTVSRSNTNTPLQALALLNEPTFLEAARKLGERMLREGSADDAARVAMVFRLATGRVPREQETRVLLQTLCRFRDQFGCDTDAARAFLNVGASPVDASLPPADLAAYAVVAGMILNLDETMSKN
jgi:hypothetical protein